MYLVPLNRTSFQTIICSVCNRSVSNKCIVSNVSSDVSIVTNVSIVGNVSIVCNSLKCKKKKSFQTIVNYKGSEQCT